MVFPMGICFAYPTKLDLEIESRSFGALCGNLLGPLLMLSVDQKFNKFKLINLFEGG